MDYFKDDEYWKKHINIELEEDFLIKRIILFLLLKKMIVIVKMRCSYGK